jgi:DNA-binding MarR family transcriptional regulator
VTGVSVDHVDRMVQAWARTAPDLDTSPLEVAGRLLRCAVYLERSIDRALRSLGLSFGDFDVINTIRRRADAAGTNPRDLAASALVTSGAMTSRLDRLERAGLVERRPDPGDRRAILVRLTPQGKERAVKALEAVLAADRRFLDPLDSDDRAAVAAALKRLLVRAEPS